MAAFAGVAFMGMLGSAVSYWKYRKVKKELNEVKQENDVIQENNEILSQKVKEMTAVQERNWKTEVT